MTALSESRSPRKPAGKLPALLVAIRTKIWVISLIFLFGAATDATALNLQCSTTNSGKVVLNELFSGGGGQGNLEFVELYFLEPTDIHDWKLYYYDNNTTAVELGLGNNQATAYLPGEGQTYSDNNCASPQCSTATTFPAGTFLVYYIGQVSPPRGELLLVDTSQNLTNNAAVAVDHLRYYSNSPTNQWTVPSGCSLSLAGHNANDKDMARIPNGTGGWMDNGSTPTLGTSNSPPPSSLDHIRLEHDGDGLTCLPEAITVKACADANCTSLYTAGNTSVTLSGTGWSSNPITFPGSTTVNLSKTTPQTVTLGTSSVSPSPAGASRCYIGVNQDCSLIFSGAGFIFAAAANGGEATIPSQTAGTSSATYYLRAIRTNTSTGACEAALAGANSVELAYECNDSATCYGANLMSVNGGAATTIARNNNGSVSSYTSTPMTFDANGNAPFTFNYGDAGRVTLHARKTVNSVLLSGASNAFLVKPHDFAVIPCAASVVGACPAAPADPGLAGGGSAFVGAGEAFKATLTARTATGAATPSFGLGSNSATETVALARNRLAPTGAGTADGALSGTTAIARNSFSNGVATVSNLAWSEAGVISLTATSSTFLGNALTTIGTSGNLGRFIPAHFAVTPGGVSEGCDPGNFTYFGQDGFATAFTLTAQNLTGATTQNYTGAFAKLDLSSWSNFVFTAAGLPVAPGPVSVLGAGATAPSGSWTSGVAAVVARHQASRPATPVAQANVTVSAKPVDADGVTLASATAVQAATTPLRYGRAVLQNAYGPETGPIKMRLLTQYYNGSSFVANADDTCTTYSAAGLSCSNLTGPVACADVTASGTNIGHGQYFTLSAPNKTGALLYTLTVDPWLQYEWDNADSDYNENPFARANFGIYRGNDRIINWREIVR